MRPAIYIRVDGSAKIGLGHIVRCTALAQMLEDDFSINFVCKYIPDDNAELIRQLGFDLAIIENESDFFLKLKAGLIVVLDHYGLDSDYQKRIKDAGCVLVCIDDLHSKTFYADLIINHAPKVNITDYKCQSYTLFALGSDYVLLRPVFLRGVRLQREERKATTLFICFGGSDFNNLTKVTTGLLKSDSRFEKILVVVGSAYPYLSELKLSIGNDQRFELYHSIDSEKIFKLLSVSGLAIVPASGILLEVMAMGCKVISGMYAENQREIFEQYKSVNAFISAEKFSANDLVTAITKTLQNEDSFVNRFDGKSSNRLLKYFKQLDLEKHIYLTNAGEKDFFKTFEWANNKNIRKYFHNSEPIDEQTHKTWFFNKIICADCYYYIGWINGDAIGSVRFDIHDRTAIISYLLDPVYQGQGMGLILLRKGLELLLREAFGRIDVIIGVVLPENIASIKIFRKLGYVGEQDMQSYIFTFRKIISNGTGNHC